MSPHRVISRRDFVSALGVVVAASALPLPGCATALSAARPQDILLIRHGEEPDHGIHLDDRGRRRAAALPSLFPSRFPTPTFLFAAQASVHTNRAGETLEPLGKALGLPVDQTFEDQHYKKLANALLTQPAYSGAHILVCWQHATLPEFAAALGVANPPHWPDKQYDHIWRIQYGAGAPTLTNLPQMLLPGDDR